jgi:hypothetical protein
MDGWPVGLGWREYREWASRRDFRVIERRVLVMRKGMEWKGVELGGQDEEEKEGTSGTVRVWHWLRPSLRSLSDWTPYSKATHDTFVFGPRSHTGRLVPAQI